LKVPKRYTKKYTNWRVNFAHSLWTGLDYKKHYKTWWKISVAVTPGTPEVLTPLPIGEVVAATLGSQAERDRWSFTLTAAKRLYFDTLTINVNGGDSYWLRWALYGPDGRAIVSDKPFRDAVYYRFEESRGSHTVPRHEGVATDRAKLIRFLDLKDAEGRPLLELFDLEADPDERTNLAGRPEHAALEAALLARLEALRAEYRAP
jgi:hypothetical protein